MTWQKKLFWDQKVLWSIKHGTNLNYIGISFNQDTYVSKNWTSLDHAQTSAPPKKTDWFAATIEATEGEGGDSGGSGQSGRQSGDQTGDMGTKGTDQQNMQKRKI